MSAGAIHFLWRVMKRDIEWRITFNIIKSNWFTHGDFFDSNLGSRGLILQNLTLHLFEQVAEFLQIISPGRNDDCPRNYRLQLIAREMIIHVNRDLEVREAFNVNISVARNAIPGSPRRWDSQAEHWPVIWMRGAVGRQGATIHKRSVSASSLSSYLVAEIRYTRGRKHRRNSFLRTVS